MTTTILTKTAKSGQAIEIQFDAEAYNPVAKIIVDGKQMGFSHVAPVKLPAPVGDVTHGLKGNKVSIGLTADEAAIITAAFVAAHAAKADPLATLKLERSALVRTISGIYDDAQAEYERRHDRQDMTAWSAKAEIEATAETVKAELAAFDVAHPEVIAAVRAEREAQRQANVAAAEWN